MRNLTLIATLFVTLVFAATPVSANTSGLCNDVYEMADIAMTARQQGEPVNKVINKLDEIAAGLEDEISDAMMDYFKYIIVTAYEITRYSKLEYQNIAIDEYATQMYLQCHKEFN